MKNKYSLSETIATAYALICTKLFYKGARLIRRPFYCRGKAKLQFDEGLTTGYSCRFDLLGEDNDNSKKLFIGKNCKLGDNVHIVANEKVIIGDNCLMASKIFISDTNHGNYSNKTIDSSPDVPPDDRLLYMRPVVIGNNVWIGENACILLGVTIGNGCIIGANSVVNRDVMDNCIVAGSPAKVIKKWDNKNKVWITNR
ncbi:DapH/DapD/GlmU-related protein [Clostridium grantii]|uniref:Acetyltransferase (Isoleucine patch superfamily) n=1 Tax=Clostridium grantii DSM 8605 TaxID=1121316 RepID=A0A1M5T8A0_9CLOT|nr:DapH/DapD/GlmU-related protein [Clostridium grantii]SHH46997.1 Acetyltransferase (isoleucine patch superfamily) [Clostridium grantii DSM 8605]